MTSDNVTPSCDVEVDTFYVGVRTSCDAHRYTALHAPCLIDVPTLLVVKFSTYTYTPAPRRQPHPPTSFQERVYVVFLTECYWQTWVQMIIMDMIKDHLLALFASDTVGRMQHRHARSLLMHVHACRLHGSRSINASCLAPVRVYQPCGMPASQCTKLQLLGCYGQMAMVRACRSRKWSVPLTLVGME